MCHRPGVLRKLRFYTKPLLSACVPWSNRGCVCKRMCGLSMAANIPCRYGFVQPSSERKTLWRKDKKLKVIKASAVTCGIQDDLKSFVLSRKKKRKITQKLHSTISIPSSAYFNHIFKWVLFYIQ